MVRLMRDAVPPILAGLTVTRKEDAGLPIKVCAEHLALFGASWEAERSGLESEVGDALGAGELTLRPESHGVGDPPLDDGIDCTIRWQFPNQHKPQSPGSEAIIQAVSGLMAVHGRDRLLPRRLGLEVASVAAGIIATQGILAALIAKSRGHPVSDVETSVLQAALLFLQHHLAIATCDGEFPCSSPESAPGPPFCTADEYWVELEVLSDEAWFAFWRQLNVEPKVVAAAWLPFVYRYLAGRCALPAALHEATRRHTLAELRCAADACGVAVCRVRTYLELLAELGWSKGEDPRRIDLEIHQKMPWTIHPGTRRSDRTWPLRAVAPLAGLRVVEVTSRLQGPLAGLLLSLLGAEVVKVEPPGGDFGKFSPPLAGSLSAAYLAYNRQKQVVELNYKQPEGRARLVDLVANADVFLHNWRSGRAEKLGFDFDDFAKVNPGIVYAHASGWGKISDEPTPIAGDYLVQAYAGCGDGLNPASEPPFPSRLTLVDVTGGLLACEGILAGLYLRERTGQGCRVDTSLFAGAIALQANVLRAITDGGEARRRLGRPLWGILDQPIDTADGYLIISGEDERIRTRLSKICGLEVSANANERALELLIAERLRSRPAAEWEPLLLEAGIPTAVVCSDLAGLPHNPRMANLLERVDNACWLPAAPWHFQTP